MSLGTPIVETRNLSKTYKMGSGEVTALTALNLTIIKGEYVAIMGPSGSGKSTCLHLLGGLQTPSAGQYLLEGQDISELGPDAMAALRNRKFGFLFQGSNLLPRVSSVGNVELPLVYRRLSRSDRRERAMTALEKVGLGDRALHRPDQLSGGQMQRVAIARALVGDPAVILADEPTGALDSETGGEILDLFATFNENGATIILVTHDPDVARRAKRVLTFRDGQMITDERTR